MSAKAGKAAHGNGQPGPASRSASARADTPVAISTAAAGISDDETPSPKSRDESPTSSGQIGGKLRLTCGQEMGMLKSRTEGLAYWRVDQNRSPSR